MIELDFVPDPNELDRFVKGQSDATKRRTLAQQLRGYPFEVEPKLIMPVRLTVNNVDLFACGGFEHPRITPYGLDASRPKRAGHVQCPWAYLSLVSVGYSALWPLRNVRPGGRADVNTVAIGSVFLTFQRPTPDAIVMSSPRTNRSVEASYSDALAAFHDFSARASQFLFAEIPELADNIYIGRWISGGPDYIH